MVFFPNREKPIGFFSPTCSFILKYSKIYKMNNDAINHVPLSNIQHRPVIIRCSFPQKTYNRPISQIPHCTCPITHNASFRTEMCTFLFWMVLCGICDTCIMGFINLLYRHHLVSPWSQVWGVFAWNSDICSTFVAVVFYLVELGRVMTGPDGIQRYP